MERRNETDKPIGICHKLFNYLVKSFPLYKLKQISRGRQDKMMTKTTRGLELVPALDIPVEHLEVISPKSSVPEDGRKRKDGSATTKKPGIHGITFVEVTKGGQKSVSFREDVEEKDAEQTKSGRSKEEQQKKKPPVAQQQESNPQAPFIKAISNINEKSDLFIQKRRESFAS